MKKEEKPKHYVQIGTIGYGSGGRTRLFELIKESIDENDKIKTNNNSGKQSGENIHKGIEINKR